MKEWAESRLETPGCGTEVALLRLWPVAHKVADHADRDKDVFSPRFEGPAPSSWPNLWQLSAHAEVTMASEKAGDQPKEAATCSARMRCHLQQKAVQGKERRKSTGK